MDQPAEQLHAEIKQELYVFKHALHLNHLQENFHLQIIVIVMQMQLEFVEMDQPVEQLHVEIMQELLVNKDVILNL
jgi:hypothetical protein